LDRARRTLLGKPHRVSSRCIWSEKSPKNSIRTHPDHVYHQPGHGILARFGTDKKSKNPYSLQDWPGILELGASSDLEGTPGRSLTPPRATWRRPRSIENNQTGQNTQRRGIPEKQLGTTVSSIRTSFYPPKVDEIIINVFREMARIITHEYPDQRNNFELTHSVAQWLP
jgi:hypothetical protein